MNSKKIKIILYLPLAIFFITTLFYYPLPVKAADVCTWWPTEGTMGNCAAASPSRGANAELSKCTDTKPSECTSLKFCLCCCKPAIINDTMPNLKIPDVNLQITIPGLNLTKGNAIKCTETDGKKTCNIPWIGEYIAGIYKYAIGIVGILAAVVLMIGGVIWIVAGGSATMIGEAKAWIGASLTGLVIALCSYLILFQINPALTIFGPLGITQVAKAPEATVSIGVSQACQKYLDPAGTNTIRYDSIKVTEKTAYPNTDPTNCSKYNSTFNSLGGIKAKYLKAIAATESSCNSQPPPSGAGSCGLMQLLPDTAKIYDSRATSCEWLINHPEESIIIASKFIDAYSGVHGGNNLTYIFAGYNSGYSTSPNPTTGKKGGLAPSSDCKGKKAFECCINPGELTETQDHVLKSIKFYNSDPF